MIKNNENMAFKKKLHIHGWGSKKEWLIKKRTMKDKFHNVYKYYNHHFLLVFTIKILSY
jgi:hypothetical protein